MKNSTFLSIDWKDAKSMIDSGEMSIIGSNYGQINNQGEFTISADGGRLYKRRISSPGAHYDLIAEKATNEKK